MAQWFGKGLVGRKGKSRLRDLGDAARDRGDWREAVEHYRAYLARNPDHFPIWVQLGHVTKEAGDPHGAEQAYRRALALRPRDADLLLNMGHLFKATGRVDEAIEHYQRSAATDLTGNAHRELATLGHRLVAEPEEERIDPPIFVERADPTPFLKGVVDVPTGHDGAVRVMLVEAGEMLGWTVAKGEGRRRAFAMRLPAEVCDGRPHAFEVMVDKTVVARLATITPTTLTPSSTLQDYAGAGLRGTAVGGRRGPLRRSRGAAGGGARRGGVRQLCGGAPLPRRRRAARRADAQLRAVDPAGQRRAARFDRHPGSQQVRLHLPLSRLAGADAERHLVRSHRGR